MADKKGIKRGITKMNNVVIAKQTVEKATDWIRKEFAEYIKHEQKQEIILQIDFKEADRAVELQNKYIPEGVREYKTGLPEGAEIKLTVPVQAIAEMYGEVIASGDIEDSKAILESMIDYDIEKDLGHAWFFNMVKILKYAPKDSPKIKINETPSKYPYYD